LWHRSSWRWLEADWMGDIWFEDSAKQRQNQVVGFATPRVRNFRDWFMSCELRARGLKRLCMEWRCLELEGLWRVTDCWRCLGSCVLGEWKRCTLNDGDRNSKNFELECAFEDERYETNFHREFIVSMNFGKHYRLVCIFIKS
jgi:hypothetical protein